MIKSVIQSILSRYDASIKAAQARRELVDLRIERFAEILRDKIPVILEEICKADSRISFKNKGNIFTVVFGENKNWERNLFSIAIFHMSDRSLFKIDNVERIRYNGSSDQLLEVMLTPHYDEVLNNQILVAFDKNMLAIQEVDVAKI